MLLRTWRLFPFLLMAQCPGVYWTFLQACIWAALAPCITCYFDNMVSFGGRGGSHLYGNNMQPSLLKYLPLNTHMWMGTVWPRLVLAFLVSCHIANNDRGMRCWSKQTRLQKPGGVLFMAFGHVKTYFAVMTAEESMSQHICNPPRCHSTPDKQSCCICSCNLVLGQEF